LMVNGSDIDKNIFEKMTVIFSEEFELVKYSPTSIASAILKAKRKIYTQRYNVAHDSLIKFLKRERKNCLIMVDSINYFQPRDNIQICIYSGLISAILQLYEHRNKDKLLAKIALPSELYPYLDPENREHVEAKNVFILWRYRDLVSLLAKRFWFYTHKEASRESFLQFENFHNSQSFIYELLPGVVTSSKGIEFDTLAYVIRHTQKKPRQIIMLFNTILTLAERLGEDIQTNTLSQETIRKGVHARLDMLVTGSFHIYNHLFPGSEQLIRRTLTEAMNFFDYATLDKYIKESSSLREKQDMSIDELRSLLLNIGVIGTRVSISPLENSNKYILNGIFEYQVKSVLTLTSRSICIVHPMFVQELKIQDVDSNSFTYPLPAEVEEKDALIRSGVQLHQ
jgi:hypothetical protein